MNPYECMDTGVKWEFAVRPAKAKTFCCPAKANKKCHRCFESRADHEQYAVLCKLKAFLANSNNRIFKYTALYVNGKIH